MEFISFEGKELGDGEELCRFTIWEELKHSFASRNSFQPDGNFNFPIALSSYFGYCHLNFKANWKVTMKKFLFLGSVLTSLTQITRGEQWEQE